MSRIVVNIQSAAFQKILFRELEKELKCCFNNSNETIINDLKKYHYKFSLDLSMKIYP